VDVDPYFLAGTITFYAETPSARVEIADGTARSRLLVRMRPVR